ncbi:MAG: peptide deformylase [bacterium]
MAIRKIVIYGSSVLRQKTSPVIEIDQTIRDLVEDMVETMIEAEGIGLAGPQVDECISLCVVNMGLIEDDVEAKAFINPVILSEEGTAVLEEGCLSIPEIREDVRRPEKIIVKYTDINGIEHQEKCDGLLARVLQHEIDHLNGVLFIDRIGPMKRKLLAKKLKRLSQESRQDRYAFAGKE